MKIFFFLVVLLIISCHSGKTAIEGTWMQPIPGLPGRQGVCLEKGGEATSVNMYTLIYKTWKRQGDRLILTGESVGNGQSLSFIDTLDIRKLTADSLVLAKGEWEIAYTREK